MRSNVEKKLDELNKRSHISLEEKRMALFEAFMKELSFQWGTLRNTQDDLVKAIGYYSEVEDAGKPIGTLTLIYELLGDLELIRIEGEF